MTAAIESILSLPPSTESEGHDSEPFAGAPPAHAPWQAVVLPAVLGQPQAAIAAMEALEAQTPPLPPAHVALCARAMAALGFTDAARDLAASLYAVRNPTCLSLSVFTHPRGPAQASRWRDRLLNTAEQADLSCDLAAVFLARGDHEGADQEVARGLHACPQHAELGRWRRFLAQAPLPLACEAAARQLEGSPLTRVEIARRQASDGGGRPVVDLAEIHRFLEDVASLVPSPATGWLSSERILRKLLSGALDRPAAPGTVERAMQDAGCLDRRFLTDGEFRGSPRSTPRLRLELLADRIESLVNERRPATATARHLWYLAREEPTPVPETAIHQLVEWAARDPLLMPIATRAVRWQLRQPGFRGRSAAIRRRAAPWRELLASLTEASTPTPVPLARTA